MSGTVQSVSPAIRLTNAKATRQHLDLPDHRKAGRQVGHGPASGSRLVDGSLVDPERRTDDPVNIEPALGRADRKGCGTPAGRLRGLIVWQHGRMHRVAHDGRIADPLRNVQPDPAAVLNPTDSESRL